MVGLRAKTYTVQHIALFPLLLKARTVTRNRRDPKASGPERNLSATAVWGLSDEWANTSRD